MRAIDKELNAKILEQLRNMDTASYTVKELAKIIGADPHKIYGMLAHRGMPYKKAQHETNAQKLAKLDTSNLTAKEIAEVTGLNVSCVHSTVSANKIPYKKLNIARQPVNRRPSDKQKAKARTQPISELQQVMNLWHQS